MHKPVISLLVTAWLSATEVAAAAYLIKLKNGNEFVTSRYWQNSKQILFETYDGTFGVEKGFVTRVEKTDRPIRLISTAQAAEAAKPVEVSGKVDAAGNKPPVENQEPAPAKKIEDDPFSRHFHSIKERANRINTMLTPEINQLVKDLQDLKRAMQLGGKTETMLAEFGELHDIADRVEEAIRVRR